MEFISNCFNEIFISLLEHFNISGNISEKYYFVAPLIYLAMHVRNIVLSSEKLQLLLFQQKRKYNSKIY